MLITDLVEETYFAVSANRTRSVLTILGIVIGIGSVIAMISIGQGAAGSIQSRIESMGANLITVSPGAQRSFSQISSGMGSANTLTYSDAQSIAQNVPLVEAVAPEVSRRYQIVAKGTNTNTEVDGTTPSYPGVRNVDMSMGSFISSQDLNNKSKVAVLGPTVVTDLFGQGADPVGQSIRINGIDFKVIGVTVAKGGSAFGSQDDMVFIPLTTAQLFLTGSDSVSSISVQAQSSKDMTSVQTGVTNLLLQLHNISDPQQADFSVLSQQDILGAASSITNTMTTLLAAIAGISLVVGGIGIMNMMMTTVTERTREIGLRKAIGAKRSDISLQFLAEAVLLTFLGGVIGVVLGAILAYGMTKFGGLPTKISTFSVLLAFGVSAGIGIVFGYWPARKASKLNPIEALRYE